jgi:hypothetical protein
MRRGRTLVWTIIASVVAAVAVAVALIHADSGASPDAASSSPPSTSAATGATEQTPVVPAQTSAAFSYLSDLKPSGNFGELVHRGPIRIAGSIYPKSISFYCNVGDPTAFPAYSLKRNARRFHATIGLAAKPPPHFQSGILLVGDGRTLRMLNVTASHARTVDVDVRGVHRLQLECFGSGSSATSGFAVAVGWGNARVSAGR